MTTELERRLIEAFHEDAQRARLTHPDGPAEAPPWMPSGNEDRQNGHRWMAAAACLALVVAGVVAVARRPGGDPETVSTIPATTPSTAPTPTVAPRAPGEPFVGGWSSTDTDGSSQTMDIVRSDTDQFDVVVRDDAATVACAGSASTMTGAGLLVTDVRLVIAQPELTCDDGTTPSLGPPPQAELANFAFEHNPEADELTDSFEVVWKRQGSNVEPDEPATSMTTARDDMTDPKLATDPSTDPTLAIDPARAPVPAIGPRMSGGMWPQSTLGEVSAAQELADAGDPSYTWQLFAQSSPDEEPWGAEILTRFIEEGLGWEEYLPRDGLAYNENGGGYFEVKLIRCASGRTNSLASMYTDMPSDIRGCAPTIDEFTYETVMLSLIRPLRQGAAGIWVVEQWSMLQPAPEPSPSSYYFFPDMEQVRQFVPPSDDEVDVVLEAFLQARVDGAGAERFLLTDPDWGPEVEAPLLYATTSGTPYARFTTPQLVTGPVWPTGWTEYKVELVAEDETVVEQYFHVIRHGDQLGLFYGFAFDHELQTTENGRAVAVPHSEFGDTVTFTAPPAQTTAGGSAEMIKLSDDDTDGRVILVYDPHPELCADPPEIGQNVRPANAEAVARSILALPGIEVTEPVPVRVAGTDGLQMDLTSSGQSDCLAGGWTHLLPEEYEEWRMRLYLVDNPAFVESPDSARGPRVLAISVTSSPDDFDDVLERATPILASIAFRAG